MASDEVTYIGAGSPAFTNNGEPRPNLPAGVAVGDLLVCLYAIRGGASFSIDDWDILDEWGDPGVLMMGVAMRVWDGAFGDPIINNLGGGISGDANGAVVLGFRGTAPLAVCAEWHSSFASAGQVNGAGTTIPVPLVADTKGAGVMLLAVGAHLDNWTSVAQLPEDDQVRWVEVVDASTTSGNDLGLVADIGQVNAQQSLVPTTFVITGTSSVVNVSRMLIIPPDNVGTSARTLSGVTRTGAGEVEIEGSSARTLSGVTRTGVGEVELEGALADRTLNTIGSGFSADEVMQGSTAVTLGPLATESEGEGGAEGTGFGTLDELAHEAEGEEAIEGEMHSTLGDVEWDSTAFSSLGISVDTLEDLGGDEVVITGEGLDPTMPALVTLRGPVGVDADFECYSGRSGSGYTPYPESEAVVRFVTPPLAVGSYDVRVTQDGDTFTLPRALHIVPHSFRSTVHALRALLPVRFPLGGRNAGEEPPQPPPDAPAVDAPGTLGATVGVPFTFTPTATTAPYAARWSVVGTLPVGLAINPTTGTISGTPTSAGLRAFTIRATTALHVVDTAATINVAT